MKISIITMVFNSEDTIENTIKSVAAQKKEGYDIEYIIVDGLSDDGTMNLVRQYEQYVDQCISEKDRGISDAMNKGIKLATGEFVFFLAADDLLLPQSMESFFASLKAETEVWTGAVISKMGGYYRYVNPGHDLNLLYYECSLRHPATFFKRELYEKYGMYNLNYACAQDREFFLRLFSQGVRFQVEDIPIVLFATNGISEADPTEYAYPEGIRLCMEYGMDRSEARQYYREKLVSSKKERKAVLILKKTKLLRPVSFILRKDFHLVKLRDKKKYGLN